MTRATTTRERRHRFEPIAIAILFAFAAHGIFFARLYVGSVNWPTTEALPQDAALQPSFRAEVITARAPIKARTQLQRPAVHVQSNDSDQLGLAVLTAKNPNLFGSKRDGELETALAGVVSIDRTGGDLSAIAARTMPSPRTEPVLEASRTISLLGGNASRAQLDNLEKSDVAPSKLRGGRAVSAGIDMRGVRAVIERRMPELVACYERAAEVETGLFGVVRVEMAIDADGRVEAVSFKESTLSDENLDRCLAKRIRGWTMPRPTGSNAVVTYPLVFNRS